MSIPEAIKGAKAEFARITSPIDKLKRATLYARIIAAELFGTLQMAPYGLRAAVLHRSLPNLEQWHEKKHQGVSIVRDIRYAEKPRCVMDIYIPPNLNSLSAVEDATNSSAADVNKGEVVGEGKPTVVFVHGGIWATGAKWHYAPMATRLAQAGIITAVMQYTLYPEAEAPQMAAEVSTALTHIFESINSYGGNPKDVSLVGHSAGGQLCAMALLNKAFFSTSSSSSSGSTTIKASATSTKNKNDGGDTNTSTTNARDIEEFTEAYADPRMPKRFVSMAGVFDIAKHFEYEQGRGVHELSTMGRAVGGPFKFASQSPAVILQHTAHTTSEHSSSSSSGSKKRSGGGDEVVMYEYNDHALPAFYKSFSLQGEAIATRVGLDRIHSTTSGSKNSSKDSSKSNSKATSKPTVGAVPSSKQYPILPLKFHHAKNLPPTVLQSSTADVTVPWFESAEMHWALTDCGVPSKNLLYWQAGHGDFVTAWRPLTSITKEVDVSDLPSYAADFVKIVTGQVDV